VVHHVVDEGGGDGQRARFGHRLDATGDLQAECSPCPMP
jgi:hypothetical protein